MTSSRSPGEIVPYAVDRSDSYREAAWITATLGALLAGLITALVSSARALGEGLGDAVLWIGGPPTVGAAIEYLLGAVWPALRVRLVHADVIEHRVRQRAFSAFVEQEVFRTQARTGILLFLSLLEHRVVVLTDAGISPGAKEFKARHPGLTGFAGGGGPSSGGGWSSSSVGGFSGGGGSFGGGGSSSSW